MENYPAYREINLPAICFTILQFVFSIIAGSLIFSMISDGKIDYSDYDSKPQIIIDGLSNIDPNSSVLNTGATVVQLELANTVSLNSPTFSIYEKAQIRKESVTNYYFKKQNLKLASIIVDLPWLEQSYQIFFEYSDGPNNSYLSPSDSVSIICLNEYLESIYPDFNCRDYAGSSGYTYLLSKYAPFFDFDYFSARANPKNPNTIYITPTMEKISEEQEKSFIEQMRAAVQSLGISPDLFNYHVIQPYESTYLNY